MRHVTAYRDQPGALWHLARVVPADWPQDKSYCGLLWHISDCEMLTFTAPPDPKRRPHRVCKTCWRAFAAGDWEENSW